ncbi:MAG: RNA methyltransferase [Ignavibacteriales bacterium]|nr:RNA methyltransferase [Ignavibacteriales bacterium]
MHKLTHDEIAKNRKNLEEFPTAERNPIYALADNIRSLYNVGSIFRSSDGALLNRLYLTGYTPYPPRREIDKTALGSTQTVPWKYFKNPLDAIDEMKEQKIKICLLELTSHSKPYYDLALQDFPMCLVIGNEITGVSKEVVASADMAIEIPMYGHKQSLNVAVAYGIVLYDCVRILQQGKRV